MISDTAVVGLAGLALKASIFLQVFALGLGATWRDATYFFRSPRLLLNSVVARNVVMPLVAIVLIKAFSFHVAIAIALGVLAVTPVPPLLPRSQLKAGGSSEYVLGLLVSQAILALVLVPVTIELMDIALGAKAHFSVRQVATLVVQTILLPLGAGMFTSRFLPGLRKISPKILIAGTALLVAGSIPLLVLGWKAFGTLSGNGALLALSIFVGAGAITGHFLGGPRPQDRTALGLATASRHPGLALAIAHANFPEHIGLVAGAIVIYLILRIVISFPYLWAVRSAGKSDFGSYGNRRVHP